ncbi:MAG: RNA polymerase sigma factor [Ginsengibacter sp.]
MLKHIGKSHDDYALCFQRGEEEGFNFFFRLLFPSLCFFANRKLNNIEEAEDIVSAAFIKIWQRHPQFNDAKSIRAYLYQIVRNDCITFYRKTARVLTMQKEINYLTHVDTKDNAEGDIIRAEFYGELYRAINTLPPECRKIFTMLYLEGKTVRETAEELGLALSTVKTQKARGLAALKKKLRPYLYCLLVAI